MASSSLEHKGKCKPGGVQDLWYLQALESEKACLAAVWTWVITLARNVISISKMDIVKDLVLKPVCHSSFTFSVWPITWAVHQLCMRKTRALHRVRMDQNLSYHGYKHGFALGCAGTLWTCFKVLKLHEGESDTSSPSLILLIVFVRVSQDHGKTLGEEAIEKHWRKIFGFIEVVCVW